MGTGTTTAHGSLRDYVWGFILSVILTAVPFWLVMSGAHCDKGTTALVIPASPRCRSWST
jgi:cytochrome o ubiquinol oxidase operon protein cyoD